MSKREGPVNLRVIAIIPARKNSKRIINKNLVKINKKQLVKFTIEAAKKSKKIQKIILTSDDDKILKIARKNKIIPIKRPKKICGDFSTTEEAIKHAYANYAKKRFIRKPETTVDKKKQRTLYRKRIIWCKICTAFRQRY